MLRSIVKTARGRSSILRAPSRKRTQKAFRLSTDLSRPDDDLFGYTLTFTSGALKGQVHTVQRNAKQDLILSSHGPSIEGLRPGDQFTLNNRDLLAWRALHRSPRPAELRRVLEEPDRPIGRIRGKMIIVRRGRLRMFGRWREFVITSR